MRLRNLSYFLVGVLLTGTAVSTAAKAKSKGGKGGGKSAATDAQAQATAYIPPYGMAGCGLGSVMVHDYSKGGQITAATTNDTSFQTSAISCSHSSNCAPPPAVIQAEQRVFIESNLRALEADVSEGGGDYTFALAQVMGCDGEGNYPEFLHVSRAAFHDIFANPDPKVVSGRYVEALRGNAKLARDCDRVIVRS